MTSYKFTPGRGPKRSQWFRTTEKTPAIPGAYETKRGDRTSKLPIILRIWTGEKWTCLNGKDSILGHLAMGYGVNQ